MHRIFATAFAAVSMVGASAAPTGVLAAMSPGPNAIPGTDLVRSVDPDITAIVKVQDRGGRGDGGGFSRGDGGMRLHPGGDGGAAFGRGFGGDGPASRGGGDFEGRRALIPRGGDDFDGRPGFAYRGKRDFDDDHRFAFKKRDFDDDHRFRFKKRRFDDDHDFGVVLGFGAPYVYDECYVTHRKVRWKGHWVSRPVRICPDHYPYHYGSYGYW
jgi:hypothetical protein